MRKAHALRCTARHEALARLRCRAARALARERLVWAQPYDRAADLAALERDREYPREHGPRIIRLPHRFDRQRIAPLHEDAARAWIGESADREVAELLFDDDYLFFVIRSRAFADAVRELGGGLEIVDQALQSLVAGWLLRGDRFAAGRAKNRKNNLVGNAFVRGAHTHHGDEVYLENKVVHCVTSSLPALDDQAGRTPE